MRHRFLLLIACTLAACSSPPPEAPTRIWAPSSATRFDDSDPHDWVDVTPSHYPVHGIDVSKYQGEIDWHADRPLENPAALDAMLAVS